MATRSKNSTALRFQEPIQPTLHHLPIPRLDRVLLIQVLQRGCLLQALSSDLQAPPSTTTAPALGPHDGPSSGVLSVQTVPLFGFSLNLPAMQRLTQNHTRAACSQTAVSASRSNEIDNDTKPGMDYKHRAWCNISALMAASEVPRETKAGLESGKTMQSGIFEADTVDRQWYLYESSLNTT